MSTAKAERLLIADDDANLVEAYVSFFEAYGYAVQTAVDGVGALAAYSAWRPDVVILDIQMPRVDGHAVAREIRRIGFAPRPFLLAVTALHAPGEKTESFKAGFDHHFVKPARLPVILAAIASRPTI
ncbi:response regulator [Paraburkholderia panacisoli]|uniref:Response regulator n=1 Tax=Paraburkholderia panacisoli TaxID=2603818 RepID=A0A5B0GXX9_9BURK|nr:response regulator [Paraburkholderia panacisoli]KAA1007798.1 response regulator [Paraburkholderia panacisoli]